MPKPGTTCVRSVRPVTPRPELASRLVRWKLTCSIRMPGVKVKSYVFSRTLKSIAEKDTELVTSDAVAFVRKLKSQPGKDIMVMSGGNFATSLLRDGLIDEIGLNIHPILLGGGVPAFLDPGMRINLELTECRQLDGGCVLVNYRVQH